MGMWEINIGIIITHVVMCDVLFAVLDPDSIQPGEYVYH